MCVCVVFVEVYSGLDINSWPILGIPACFSGPEQAVCQSVSRQIEQIAQNDLATPIGSSAEGRGGVVR